MTAAFTTDVTVLRSSAVLGATPKLSVLVPFYKDNPTSLLHALTRERAPQVEILFYDDGSGDPQLSREFGAQVEDSDSVVTLITAHANRGRSAARNALQHSARAHWVLFLDADMLPGRPDFLSQYLRAMTDNNADIIFGGFTVPARADTPDRDLHRALSQISDCLPLSQRIKAGPQYVASSNLCVRKSVLQSEAFDDGFSGWGWEDSEWAARVAKRFTLRHIDNSALHLGLETDATLLSRFQNSAQNYLRFTDAHPDLAQTLPLYRLMQKLSRVPAQGALRPIYKGLVLGRALPMRLRVLGLKLWRASWYATAYKNYGGDHA